MFEVLSHAETRRPGINTGVTLSIINFETWSGKPEPGIATYSEFIVEWYIVAAAQP
jgi:hypothetical protein